MSTLAQYVRAMGRGPSKGRNLTQDEARDAMTQILGGDADPHAIGALFMLMRYRGETPNELAGFVEAFRAETPKWASLDVALDWPSYAAGRTRGWPLFLYSAQIIAALGHSVLIHGWNSHQSARASVANGVQALGIQTTRRFDDTAAALAADKIAYLPLDALSPKVKALLALRDVLGLRSPVNSALRAFNPSEAPATVQGVFHPVFRDLQLGAGRLLGQPNLIAIKGGGGEFEVNPTKDTELYALRGGTVTPATISPTTGPAQRLADISSDLDHLADVKSADAEAVILSTAATALMAVDAGADHDRALQQARAVWSDLQKKHKAA